MASAANRMPTGFRTLGLRIARLERDLKELRAARRSAVTGTWADISVANGWTASGGTWQVPQARQEPTGIVQVVGSLAPGTLTAGTTIATLPWAPTADLEWRVGGGAATASADLYVTSAGAVILQNVAGTITRISLTVIRFPIT